MSDEKKPYHTMSGAGCNFIDEIICVNSVWNGNDVVHYVIYAGPDGELMADTI